MIQFSHVEKEYVLGGEKWVFGPATFQVSSSSSVCVLGASGSGKSTLLHILGLLDSISSGSVSVDEVDIQSLADDEKSVYRKKNIGFVFQDFYLLEELTVFENIRLSLDIAEGEERVIQSAVQEVIDSVGLSGKELHTPSQLSGGQRQRVAIARAIVHEPMLLLADEPTGNLDAKTGASIVELLFDLHTKNGMGFWCVTHDRTLADAFDVVISVDDGKVQVERPTQ